MKAAVWLARLILGGTFLISGLTKIVDPYGSLTKIEAYLTAWGINDVIPAGIALVGGCALAMLEFTLGMLLVSGSLRRSAALGATALMAFMLPLTIYIALENPVDDCGCFGDFMVISNQATMWKNVVLMALALFLLRYNRRADCLFAPWIKWVEIALTCGYLMLLAIIGYHDQPLLDFRAYPVGEPLVDDGGEVTYIYSRDGETREFSEDAIPDESEGWEFEDVRVEDSGKMLALFDRATGEDVTDEVIGSTNEQMILLLPYPSDASAAGSYTANELQQAMESRFGAGSFIAVTAADSAAVERAIDLMMSTYPVYYSDPKAISAVARGSMALVYLKGGIVEWKRTLSSINLDRLSEESSPAEVYAINGPRRFRLLTTLYLLGSLAIMLLGTLSKLRGSKLRGGRGRA